MRRHFGGNSSCVQNEFDADEQIYNEMKQTELEEKVEQLTRENNTLKAQFEHALSISSGMKGCLDSKGKLESKILKLKSENSELNNRFEIYKHSQNEIITAKDMEIASLKKQLQLQSDTYKCETDKITRNCDEQLQQILKENQLLTQSIDQYQVDNKQIESKLNKLFVSASMVFQDNVASIDDVIAILETPVKAPSTTSSNSEPKPSVVTNNDHSKKVKRLKQKLHDAKEINFELQSKIRDFESQINDILQKASTERRNAEKEIENLKEEKEFLELNFKNQIRILESKLASKKQELSSTKPLQESNIQYIPTPIVSSIPTYEPRFVSKAQQEDSNIAVDELSARVGVLSKQLKAATKSRDEALSRVESVTNDASRLASSLQKTKAELESQLMVHRQTVLELESMRSALHSRELSPEADEEAKNNKRKFYQMKMTIDELQQQVKRQSNELNERHQSTMQLRSEINDLKKELKAANERIEDSEEAKRKLADDLAIAEKKRNEVIEEPVPDETWHVDSLPSDLLSIVERIGRNDSLQTSSKIQSAIRAICSYFNDSFAKSEKDHSETSEYLARIRNSIHHFIVDLSIALNGSAMTIEDFEGKRCGVLIEQVQKLVQDKEYFSKQYAKCSDIAQHVTEVLGSDNPYDAVVEAAKKIINLKKKIAKHEKQNTCQRFKVANAKKDIRDVIETLQSENSKMSNELMITKKSLEEAESEAKKYKSEARSLKLKIAEMESDNEKIILQNQTVVESTKQQYEAEKARYQAETNEEIRRITETLNQTADSLDESKDQISQLKQVISVLKQQIDDAEESQQVITQNAAIAAEEARNKYENEKADIINSYEDAIAQLKEQCVSYRNDISKLSSDVASSEKRRKESDTKIIELKKCILKLNAEIKETEERFNRDRKLFEASLNANAQQNESQASETLLKQKEKYEKEKRSMIQYIAQEFSQFANTMSALDVKAMKTIVSSASHQLQVLQKSDASIRRMTHATTDQRTEDAVALLLVDVQ